ncbi:MAG: apolipoprotein N-acyltransferase [Alphaproteobacteria bacterium]
MKQFFFIFLIGAFASLSMAPTNFWPALLFGLAVLYVFTRDADTIKQSFALGYGFSLGYFGFSLSWIGNALLIDGNPYWWAWPLAISGLPILLSCFTACACALYKRVCRNTTNLENYIIFCTCLSVSEYLRGNIFTGFPWNLYGYTWADISPIAQFASLTSIYGLTFITILWSASIVQWIETTRKKTIALLILSSVIIVYGYGLYKIETYSPSSETNYTFRIIQPNIKQSEKWKPEKRAQNFLKLLSLSKYKENEQTKDSKAHYIIWPETAIAPDITNAPWAMDLIKEILHEYPTPVYLITGALRSENGGYYNAILTFNKNAEIIHVYNKRHLVPFGEYMPFEEIIDIAPIVGFTGFKSGTTSSLFTTPENITISQLVCYEILFPRYSREHQSNVIINVTNDAWYGKTAGPYQHLTQAKFRAIETQIPILRSANTGISAIISPLGHILKYRDLDEKGYILQKIPISIAKLNQSNYIEELLILILITLSIIVNKNNRIQKTT